MYDDEDTSRGGSGNNSDNEGGYDSSGSYLDIDESCISSIDYCYSEEENYVSENDDTCDDDKTKRLNEDISAAISERGVPNSELMYGWGTEEHDNSSKMVPQRVQFLVGEHTVEVSCSAHVAPTLLHLTRDKRKFTDDKCDSELAEGVDALKLSMPPKDIWKKTWPKESKNILVHVYGYYNKEKGFGGHTVIVRDMSAMPIAASANFTRYGLSYLHHVLKGLEDGLNLARKHGCSSPTVLCNSRLVAQLLRKAACDGCRCNSKTVRTVCAVCTLKTVPHLKEVYVRNLVPHIETLQRKRGPSTFEWDSGKNEAVRYLAKLVKSNSLYHGYRFDQWVMEEPKDYKDELVDILFKDACNFDERIGIAVSKASTGNTSKDGDRAGNNISGDIRDGNVDVVAANGSNSNITSNAGNEVVLSTREEEIMTKGVKSMAEKGQGGDDAVNSSVGETIGGGNSIASATAKDSNTVEASVENSGTEGWISVERKKNWIKKSPEANEGYPVKGKKIYSMRNTQAKGVETYDISYYKELARKFSRLQN
ncbi:uncharacterized protein LOC113337319 [Papaver somniferum]|uniref:uncharacterized protein LOC113337319 n=1 Tax=Papaver somniferum TaxID=3469 RepID=UPI000E70122A|nr:uncharacterized protein LOC113337319 [Papaver somniferum]